jgi:hypothetical protein
MIAYSWRRRTAGRSITTPLISAASTTSIVCVTPAWGTSEVASAATLTLIKGAYEYATPRLVYSFQPSWSSWSSSRGRAAGGDVITISGSGFNVSAAFYCRFSFNGGQALAESLPAMPRSASEVQCVTPQWRFAEEGLTSLELYSEGVKMLQASTSSDIPLVNASYQFVPGFVLSTQAVVLQPGETATVSMYPDTVPTSEIILDVICSDPSVVSVISPLRMLPAVASHLNVRTIELTYLRPGTVTLSLSPRGGNYDSSLFSAVMSVSCRAQIAVAPSALTLRKGTFRDITLTGNPPPKGVLQHARTCLS